MDYNENPKKYDGFLTDIKVSNIQSSKATIEVHRNILSDCIKEIFSKQEDLWSKKIMKEITVLDKKNISETDRENIDNNLIGPILIVALNLKAILLLPDEKTKGLVRMNIASFKKSMVSLLTLAQNIKDSRLSEVTKNTADDLIAFCKQEKIITN